MHRVVTAEQLEPVERREVDSFECKEELREVEYIRGQGGPFLEFEKNLSLRFE